MSKMDNLRARRGALRRDDEAGRGHPRQGEARRCAEEASPGGAAGSAEAGQAPRADEKPDAEAAATAPACAATAT